MKLWRIATETRKYGAADLSGKGAASHPGRWNDENEPVIYTGQSIAMAVLETAAYIDDFGLPLNKFLIEVDVPDAVWAKREEILASALPPGWSAIPAGRVSVQVGSDWLVSKRTAVLLVPSVIVPEELVALINPNHPDSAGIAAKTVRLFEYNRLFRN